MLPGKCQPWHPLRSPALHLYASSTADGQIGRCAYSPAPHHPWTDGQIERVIPFAGRVKGQLPSRKVEEIAELRAKRECSGEIVILIEYSAA